MPDGTCLGSSAGGLREVHGVLQSVEDGRGAGSTMQVFIVLGMQGEELVGSYLRGFERKFNLYRVFFIVKLQRF